jgi:hypothetical protein
MDDRPKQFQKDRPLRKSEGKNKKRKKVSYFILAEQSIAPVHPAKQSHVLSVPHVPWPLQKFGQADWVTGKRRIRINEEEDTS